MTIYPLIEQMLPPRTIRCPGFTRPRVSPSASARLTRPHLPRRSTANELDRGSLRSHDL